MNIIYTKPDCKPAEVTIFAIPKPFVGHIGLIQYNAIASWTQLKPKPEIFLHGDEAGIKEVCQELDLVHIPNVERNKYGTPLLDGIFAETCGRASHDIVAYLNADIILIDNFLTAISSVDIELDRYLTIGRRWNIDQDRRLSFEHNWQANLKSAIAKRGYLADDDCKDYFVFPRHLFASIPAFAVGRGYWDTWMVTTALARNYAVVDCSLVITAIHQNHPYNHIRGGRNEAYMGREAQSNQILGNITQPGNIARANWLAKSWRNKSSPVISIIIVVEDSSQAVEKLLLSILVQNYDSYEIIVVDNTTNKQVETALAVDRNRISYFNLSSFTDINPYRFGLTKSQGELVTFLDGKSILLSKVLSQQATYFAQNASTLDILLCGSRIIEENVDTVYMPWQQVPELDDRCANKSYLDNVSIENCVATFRSQRLNYLPDTSWNEKESVVKNLFLELIYKGCKADWLKIIAENRYI